MQPLRDRWLKKALATIPGSSLKGKPGSLIILALAYVEEKPTAQYFADQYEELLNVLSGKLSVAEANLSSHISYI